MELFSNLTWAIVIGALWLIWLAIERRGARAILLPKIGIQIIGLAMVSAILLPVISVSDDLHASAIPAEVERVCSWTHRQSAPQQAAHVPQLALAFLVLCFPRLGSRTTAFLTSEKLTPRRLPDGRSLLWSRPPPAA